MEKPRRKRPKLSTKTKHYRNKTTALTASSFTFGFLFFMMGADLQQLSSMLEASLDPVQNKQAEITLRQGEKEPRFSLSLLQIVASDSFNSTGRLASALYFKNFIKRTWTDEDGRHRLPQEEVVAIKRELIGLMVSVPSSIQYQLGDAIGVIADSDFWEKWDTLVDDLVSRLESDNLATNNGVLQVAHSIFKRWRPLYRSDPLFIEINHVLEKFGAPFLRVIASTDSIIEQNQSNKEVLSQAFASMNLIIKLIYDLSVHDLPPIFEEQMSAIANLLRKYLTYENKLLETDEDSEAGPIEHVKAGIFEILQMWVMKYDEDFGTYVSEFIERSWSLLTALSVATKYDILVSKALQFLTAVTKSVEHAQSFSNESILGQVIEHVILPNVTLRDSDMEVFEDEPIEFTRRDLEGSDSDTRRRAATDFLRQLMEKYPELVSNMILRYIEHCLSDYAKDPSGKWKSKDTAVYLYSAIAAKGAVTASQGVTSTNDFANVVDFFQKNVASDLVGDSTVMPILKVDAIKYLYTFRSLIAVQQWQDAFPLLVQQLGSSDYVVYTYAAIALERTMALTTPAKQPVIDRESVTKLSSQLLQHVFTLIEADPQPAKLQENEFLMRCVMRVLIVIREGVVPIVDVVMSHLLRIIDVGSQNPSNPRFCYYLFEAMGAFIRFAAPQQPEKLENDLYGSFANILRNDVQEFMPYVFQLFAALLEANPSGTLSEYYRNLIDPVLTPTLWTSKGNIPALVRLLTSIIPRGVSVIEQNNQLEKILGLFSQLIGSKSSETYGFELLECVISSFSKSSLEQYFPTVIHLLLTRLQNHRTDSFALRFVRLYHFISASDDKGFGADFFIQLVEQTQEGVFVPLYLTVILPETQKLVRPLDRKIAVISLTKTLAGSAAFAEKYKKGWAFTCEALLSVLKNPIVPANNTDDNIVEQDPDDMSFGVGFTQLTTIRRPLRDPWSQITDVRSWIATYLKESDRRHNGRISAFSEERLSAEVKPVFAEYIISH